MSITPRRVLTMVWPVASLVAGLAVLVGLLGGASPAVVAYLVQGLVMVITCVGLYVFVGNSGVLSLGHAAFMGVGAYVGGIASISLVQRNVLLPSLPGFARHTVLSLWPAAALGALVAGVIGYLIAIPIGRLGGLAAGVATLAVLQISQNVFNNWRVLSSDGGTTPGVPVDTTPWSTWLALVIVIVVAYLYQRSRWGIRLRASREDLVAASSVGVNIIRERRFAFALSAAIVGFGGVFYVHSIGTLTGPDYYFGASFTMLAMLVIGGINSLAGAVTGAVALAVITDSIARLQNGQGLGPITITLPNGVSTGAVAVLLILVLILRPAGLTGGREISFPRRWRTPRQGGGVGTGSRDEAATAGTPQADVLA
jgi:branched-chain amino acid transport system permease protein